MAEVKGSRGGLKAEINVTPLVDVVLVLLIIFMVVTPLLTRGRDVQLPVASAVERERESNDALVLTVLPDKRLFLENRPIALADLASELRPRLRARGGGVVIKADASVSVRELRPLLRVLKSEKVHEIAFAVADPEGTR